MMKTIKAMTTMAVDNLLCMKNGGTEWTIVSYLGNKKQELRYKQEKKILGGPFRISHTANVFPKI